MINYVIVFFSLLFYASFGIQNIPILVLPFIGNFFLGILISKVKQLKYKKLLLFLGIVTDLTILAYFKYGNFFVTNVKTLNPAWFPNYQLMAASVIPVGVSFITFQRISYIFDIYRRKIKPSYNFLNYITYAAIFPHLISGPIVRYADIKNELSKRIINAEILFIGFKYFVVGLAIKVLLADNLYPLETLLKTQTSTNHFFESILLVFYFSLRIYLDFTGYSLIAVGLAKIMGFDFPQNFNAPYRSLSIGDFWDRWNITLSRWLRDYLFIPLGGSRKGEKRTYINLLITMLLGGFWHGANWNFILWGGLHGIYLSIEHFCRYHNIHINLPNFIKRIGIFLLISVTWLTFVFSSPSEVLHVLNQIISLNIHPLPLVVWQTFLWSTPWLLLSAIWVIFLSEGMVKDIQPNWINSFLLIVLFLITLNSALSGQGVPFIYFQF